MAVITNQFWIAANIIIDTNTGETRQVLMLVNKEADATVFYERGEALTYFSFVTSRIKHVQWHLDDPIPQRPLGWVIRGIQTKHTTPTPIFTSPKQG